MNRCVSIILLVSLIGFSFHSVCASQKVVPGYNWSFPQDHGDHPSFETEWWYYTGHIQTTKNRTFGFELTFFRNNQSSSSNRTIWTASPIFLAHFAVTDDENQQFFHDSRTTRSAYNQAGAKQGGLDVHNGDWSAKQVQSNIYLSASMKEAEIELVLTPIKPPILQGNDGYSRKSNRVEMASYYYSYPRLTGEGMIRIGSESFSNVSVSAWFDHEFFSHSLLQPGEGFGVGDVKGWDWFAIQFDDGYDMMIYKVRHAVSKDDYYFGAWVDPNGSYETLGPSDFQIEVLDRWISRKTRANYPAKWRIEVPKKGVAIVISPTVKHQELFFGQGNALNYWEGRCLISGSHNGQAYVELAGYSDPIK